MMRALTLLLLGSCAAAALAAVADAGYGDPPPHRRVTISGSCQQCDFAGQNLSDALVIGAQFDDSDFSHATLINAGLQECRFSDTNLNDANLTGARFSGVAFIDSDLSGAHLINIRGDRIRFTDSRLTGGDLSGAQLVLVSFDGADLSNAVLARAQLHHAEFTDATLDRAVFRDARMPRADFTQAEGARVVFVNADLRAANFSGARLERADFTGARLDGAVLAGAQFARARGLTEAQLVHACGDEETDLPGDLIVPPCPPRALRTNGVVTVSSNGRTVQVIDTARILEAQAAAVAALREVGAQLPNDLQIEVRRSGDLAEVRRSIELALDELRREEERTSAMAQANVAEAERREAELAAARARLEAMEHMMRDHRFPQEIRVPGTSYTFVVSPDGEVMSGAGGEAGGFRWEFRSERGEIELEGGMTVEPPAPPMPPKPADLSPLNDVEPEPEPN
ncbi:MULTISPECIES: pentapeptide repeat-containing protein [Hyphobacterium]|uniref:Pentapeptide repeat-containing protein n=1 Tax=Hyphobacterium vulgare TaxID=1736751 RepID=A0ABV7A197_9PROT